MRKQRIAVAALAFCMLAGSFAAAGAQITPADAAEAGAQATLDAENASLFLPQSYEQYLPLQAPSHAAFSENHIAVADGSTLYVYDRAQNVYAEYEHKTGQDQIPTLLSELQFTKDGRLFFTDQRTTLYSFDLTTHQAERQAVSCSTFLFVDDTLYYATTTSNNLVSFYYVPFDSINSPEDVSRQINQTELRGFSPHLTYENGILHCVFNDNPRLSFDTRTHTIVSENARLNKDALLISGLRYVCAFSGSIYYTVNVDGAAQGNGLYRTDEGGNSSLVLKSDGLSTLATHDGKLYCVKGASVMEIGIGEGGATFTGYEIASASSSQNRLSGACDTARAGNLLVTADAANNRVSVYDFSTKTFTSHAVYNVSTVCTDGRTIAATDGDVVTVFTYGKEEEKRYHVGETMGKIKGLACFFSTVYYVTENNAYGSLDGDNVFYSGLGVPRGIACDLYGKLYVSYHDGGVYAFDEADFQTRGTPERVSGVTLPEGYASFRCDFEGNLYCLANDALYKNGEPFASFQSDPFVYGGVNAPLSCAVGFEDDGVYFCLGDYLVKSNEGALAIPTLDKIALDGAKEQIFSTGDAESLLVDVNDNAVGIEVDLAAIGESETYFPYAGYARVSAVRGVRIARSGVYSLVLVERDRSYETLLFRTENVKEADAAEYYEKAEGKAYLSNEITVCFYPCLEKSLGQNRLSRGTSVEMLAKVTLPQRVYALVSYQTEAGERLVYLPESYLSDVPPFGYPPEDYKIAYLKAGEWKFYSASGEELTVTERTQVRLYRTGEDTYRAKIEHNSKQYFAEGITQGQIDTGSGDALRVSLIVILSVLAVIIAGVYIYLLPLRNKRG